MFRRRHEHADGARLSDMFYQARGSSYIADGSRTARAADPRAKQALRHQG